MLITKSYGDASTDVPYVSFATLLVKNDETTGAPSGIVPFGDVREMVTAVRLTPSSLAFVVAKDGQVAIYPDAKLTFKSVTDVVTSPIAETPVNLVRATSPLEVELAGILKLFKA